jgi:hypothetical protein
MLLVGELRLFQVATGSIERDMLLVGEGGFDLEILVIDRD